MTSFNDFGLAEPIIRALAAENYVTPTPIQSQTIPLTLEGRDIVGIAQTGTGKTAAFALPILNRLLANKHRPERKACRVLVLSPTRELSAQIVDSFRTYGKNIRPLDVELAIGGVPINRQIRGMANGAEVLVATPGRLLDLVQQRAVRLDKIEVLVLDEADRMLDMGFVRDIRRIVAMVPADRQTLFFSATMPQEIASLAAHMLRDPAKVSVTPQASTAERVSQRVILIDKSAKLALLADTLRTETIGRAIVFTRTKHGADKVVRGLAGAGIEAQAIHGNKSQNNRERTLAAFRDGSLRVLIATDIAARGIDVDGVTHVINHDLPNVPESYVHRIGRTARAGADGVAISFCDHEEAAYLRDIERLIRMKIPSTSRRGEAAPVLVKVAQSAAPVQANDGQSAGRDEPRDHNRGQHRDHGRGGRHRNGHGHHRAGHDQSHGQPHGHRPSHGQSRDERREQNRDHGRDQSHDQPRGENRAHGHANGHGHGHGHGNGNGNGHGNGHGDNRGRNGNNAGNGNGKRHRQGRPQNGLDGGRGEHPHHGKNYDKNRNGGRGQDGHRSRPAHRDHGAAEPNGIETVTFLKTPAGRAHSGRRTSH